MTLNLLRQLFACEAIGQSPLPNLLTPPGMEVDGGLVPPGAIITALNAVQSSGYSGDQQQFGTTAAATFTLTSAQQLFQRFTAGGAVVVTIDYAYNIVNSMQYPFLGQSWGFQFLTIAATTIATPTLSDSAVTLVGTTSLAASTLRYFQGQITQLYTTSGAALTSGTTFVSLAQVGTTNGYTVTLATNAISPTVGQVIFLNVTAGTLPAGWYPIVKVTSATSFVIAAPPSGTAWTATTVTLPGTTVVPASQYTLGSPTTGPVGGFGVYSPLVSITGMGSVVTASA